MRHQTQAFRLASIRLASDWHPSVIQVSSYCHQSCIGSALDWRQVGIRLASDGHLMGIRSERASNGRRIHIRLASDWHLTGISLWLATQWPAARHPPNPLDMPHARARIPPTPAGHRRATHTLLTARANRLCQLRLADGPVARLVPPSVSTGVHMCDSDTTPAPTTPMRA